MTQRKAKSVAVADLRPHPKNYKQHPEEQLDHLVRSLEENGQYRNVVIAEDDTILAGHGVVLAAQRMGLGKVLAVRMPWSPDDPRALKLLALDNEVARLAPHDDNALADLLREVQAAEIGLLGTGFDDGALDALIAACRPVEPKPPKGPPIPNQGDSVHQVQLTMTRDEAHAFREHVKAVAKRFDATSTTEAVLKALEYAAS